MALGSDCVQIERRSHSGRKRKKFVMNKHSLAQGPAHGAEFCKNSNIDLVFPDSKQQPYCNNVLSTELGIEPGTLCTIVNSANLFQMQGQKKIRGNR